MTAARTASTVLILLGVALMAVSPVLAVLDYSLWGGDELLPENNWSLSIPGWILLMFYGGLIVLTVGVIWKLVVRKQR